jgi:hypothetical protein
MLTTADPRLALVRANASLALDTASAVPLPPRLLAAIALDHAAFADFDLLVDPRRGERTHRRVYLGPTHDVWLIRWGPGSATEMHDHGGSAGALYVAAGSLVEYRPGRNPADGPRRRRLDPFTYRAMRADHVHEVVNESHVVAASLHVYSPPLTTMQHYEAAPDGTPRATHREAVDLGTLQTDGGTTNG